MGGGWEEGRGSEEGRGMGVGGSEILILRWTPVVCGIFLPICEFCKKKFCD